MITASGFGSGGAFVDGDGRLGCGSIAGENAAIGVILQNIAGVISLGYDGGFAILEGEKPGAIIIPVWCGFEVVSRRTGGAEVAIFCSEAPGAGDRTNFQCEYLQAITGGNQITLLGNSNITTSRGLLRGTHGLVIPGGHQDDPITGGELVGCCDLLEGFCGSMGRGEEKKKEEQAEKCCEYLLHAVTSFLVF